jgi:hypothetical protein
MIPAIKYSIRKGLQMKESLMLGEIPPRNVHFFNINLCCFYFNPNLNARIEAKFF